MEIALLWLDDLDDWVFSAAQLWEVLRRLVLRGALAAAFLLALCELSIAAAHVVYF